jgi:hypothetical protein
VSNTASASAQDQQVLTEPNELPERVSDERSDEAAEPEPEDQRRVLLVGAVEDLVDEGQQQRHEQPDGDSGRHQDDEDLAQVGLAGDVAHARRPRGPG